MVGIVNGGDQAYRLAVPLMPRSHCSEAMRNGDHPGWFLCRFLRFVGNHCTFCLTTMLVKVRWTRGIWMQSMTYLEETNTPHVKQEKPL
jgi:hypothetical protein